MAKKKDLKKKKVKLSEEQIVLERTYKKILRKNKLIKDILVYDPNNLINDRLIKKEVLGNFKLNRAKNSTYYLLENLLKDSNKIMFNTYNSDFLRMLGRYADYKSSFSSNTFTKYSEQYPVSSKLRIEEIENQMRFNNRNQITLKYLAKINSCSQSTIRNFITNIMNYKYSKLSKKDLILNSNVYSDEVLIYFSKLVELIDKGVNLVFIDECSFSRNKNTSKLWNNPKKQTKVMYLPEIDSLNLLLAISNDRIIQYKVLKSTNNRFSFFSFLEQVTLVAKNLYGTNFFLVYDNSPIHKALLVSGFIIENNINVMLLPKYCPAFNPVEFFFCLLKQKYRSSVFPGNLRLRQMTSYCMNIIEELILDVDSNVIRNFYLHSIENIINYIAKLS